MATFPRDRFDELPDDVERVGAHRAPRPRGRGWIAFGWATLATAVLVVVGLVGLSAFDSRFELPIFAGETETPSETPTVIETAEPVTDPSTLDPAFLATVTTSVLNGTPTQGLGATVAKQIAAAGWPAPSSAAASSSDVAETIVYYPSADYEGVARGMMQTIGAADVQLSDAFPITVITVVVGADYVAPAAG